MTTASRQECIICAENFTSKNEATCIYCEYITCRTCARQYVLNENEPKCMNCKKPWTREHQNDILKPIFVNGELKKHLERVMFDQERAQLVATMEIVENRRISQRLSSERTILTQELTAIRASLSLVAAKIREKTIYIRLAKTAPKMHPDINVQEYKNDCALLELEQQQLLAEQQRKIQRWQFIDRIFLMTPEQRRIVYENQIDGATPNEILHTIISSDPRTRNNPASAPPKRHFVRACPIEDCRGFLSSQWKCGLCGVNTCSKCHVPKRPRDAADSSQEEDGSHICNPDDVATAELLANDTKPCPKCGTGIFKIDGCDQMWCTECHTAFSWRTGELATGHVHNPHFFEYQRRIGNHARNIMDLPCNAMNPQAYHGILIAMMRNAFGYVKYNPNYRTVSNEANVSAARSKTADVSMSIAAFSELLHKYRTDAIQNHLELRVKYLTEEINEAQFRSNLFRDSKKFNKDREIGQVIQTVVFAMTDILTRLVDYLRQFERTTTELVVDISENSKEGAKKDELEKNHPLLPHPADKILEILSETDKLIEYANECLAKICIVYKVSRVGLFIRQSFNPNGDRPWIMGIHTVDIKLDKDGNERIVPKIRS